MKTRLLWDHFGFRRNRRRTPTSASLRHILIMSSTPHKPVLSTAPPTVLPLLSSSCFSGSSSPPSVVTFSSLDLLLHAASSADVHTDTLGSPDGNPYATSSAVSNISSISSFSISPSGSPNGKPYAFSDNAPFSSFSFSNSFSNNSAPPSGYTHAFSDNAPPSTTSSTKPVVSKSPRWSGKYHFCTQAGCGYKGKEKGHITMHLSSVHNIGVTWLTCGVGKCGFQTKQVGHLTRHKSGVHGIGVVWR